LEKEKVIFDRSLIKKYFYFSSYQYREITL